ncbi:hypothetical protein Tco_0186586, partial [Tanacetum coccineum]
HRRPEYPEYLAPSDDEISVEDQPLPADALPTALSSGYVADSDPLKEDPKEEEEDSSKDDDKEEEEEASEEDQEEEHLALVDFVVLPAIDLVPLAEETEPFETDESGATPPPPQISLLTRERESSMASSYKREAVYARQACSRSEDRSMALEALIRTREARTTALEA